MKLSPKRAGSHLRCLWPTAGPSTCPRSCLHSSEPVEGGDEEDEAHEAGESLFAAQGDPAEAFDPLKEILDLVALGIKFGVKGRLDRPGRVGLNLRLGSKTVHDQGPQMAGVIGRIGDDMADALEPLDQSCSLRTVAALPRRRDQAHRQPERIDSRVDLGGQSATRPPDPLSLRPPLRPSHPRGHCRSCCRSGSIQNPGHGSTH